MSAAGGAPRTLPEIVAGGEPQSGAMVASLAAAFADDPAMSWIFPARAERLRRLPGLFAALVSEDLRLGEALISPGAEAVTLWHGSGHVRTSPWQLLRELPGFFALLGPHTLRALRISHAIKEHHPAGMAYSYLHFAGVDPAFQGRGWGGAVIRAGQDRARAAGLPVYLETATPENVGLYQRLGFTVTQEWNVAGGGPHFWSMLWRPG